MSTGLAVFDTTVQETNGWLKAVEAQLPPCDRPQAYNALRAVLQVLRDRLPLAGVLGLSAQLPLLLRGVALEGWRPTDGVSAMRDPEAFAVAVAERLSADFPRPSLDATRAVLAVLAARLDPGEVRKLMHLLPESLRDLWPASASAV